MKRSMTTALSAAALLVLLAGATTPAQAFKYNLLPQDKSTLPLLEEEETKLKSVCRTKANSGKKGCPVRGPKKKQAGNDEVRPVKKKVKPDS